MKVCRVCNIEKPLESFGRAASCKDGYRNKCKKCYKSYYKEYACKYKMSNRSKLKKIDSRYYETFRGHFNRIFNAIKRRCTNPKCKDYKNYGGRGIKCLFASFDEFIQFLTANFSSEIQYLQIDRINNDGNYSPYNIRFVTQRENNQNKQRVEE